MSFRKYLNFNLLTNSFVVLLLLFLPYYLFEGKLFIGGDDTRLFYLYPWEYIQNIAFYSWNSFSSFGSHNPNQYSLPLLIIWTLVSSLISSKTILNYLSFSLPIILAFLSFRYLVYEIVNESKSNIEKLSLIGAILYILSPITLLHQISVFLITVWFLAILPLLMAFFLKFIKSGRPLYIMLASLCALVFSIAFYSIPWLLGSIIPITVSVFILLILYRNKISLSIINRAFLFLIIILLIQSFWLLPFVSTFLVKSTSSFGGNTLTGIVADTFRPVVSGTATGNILNPLMNLPHQQIIFDYNWPVKDLFNGYYRILFPFNLFFALILFGGLLNYKTVLIKNERRNYLAILGGFVVVLFLFTVNIGPFKELFIYLGNIPGFVMFRNFYDKFAIGYIFYFSLIITYSLWIIDRKFKYTGTISFLLLAIILINAVPIKNIINAPLWGTDKFSKNISYPEEFLEFIRKVDEQVEESSNILSIPFNIASYAIITDNKNAEAYIGTSPVTLLTGIKNLSGNMSLSSFQSKEFQEAVESKNYSRLKNFFRKLNINYVLIYKAIPPQVKSSYLYDKNYSIKENSLDILSFTERKIITSRNNRFALYETGAQTTELSGDGIIFKKVSPVEFWIALPSKFGIQNLTLIDSYHDGWNFYQGINFLNKCEKRKKISTVTECVNVFPTINFESLNIFYKAETEDFTQIKSNDYTNTWDITSNKNLEAEEQYSFYKLYFTPQLYFYVGLVFTLLTFGGVVYWFIAYEKNKK